MKTRPIKPRVIMVDLPDNLAGVVRVADERTGYLFRHWGYAGDLDLKTLLRSVYLQGVEDGAAAAERDLERRNEVNILDYQI